MEVKETWVKRQKEIIGDEIDLLKETIFKPLPSSFRINTLKTDKAAMVKRLTKEGWKLNEVPFYENGFVLSEKKSALGNTVEHFLGYIYIQEVASMLPPVVLDPNPNEIILDMAAAPGSKTTQLSQIMKNNGAIFANEKDNSRLVSLNLNLQRCGVSNVAVTNMDARAFGKLKLNFDKILLDAPCTGSGAAMKSEHALDTWSENASKKMASLQRQLITSAAGCLKKDGVLVYSTCSLEPEEDEEVVDYAVKNFGLTVEPIKLPGFKTKPGITEWNGKGLTKELDGTIRVYPQDNNTEGFFVARLRK